MPNYMSTHNTDLPIKLRDFIFLTGINFFKISIDNKEICKTPCGTNLTFDNAMTCLSCCHNLLNALQNTIIDEDNIFFCQSGLCFIYTVFSEEPQHIYLSSPIVCTSPGIKRQMSCTVFNCSLDDTHLTFLSPSAIIKSSRILLSLTCKEHTSSYNFYRQIEKQIQDMIEKEDEKEFHALMERLLETVIERNGLDFFKLKSACIHVMFLLYETLDNFKLPLPDESDYLYDWQKIAASKSISQIKNCFLMAEKDFSASFSHAAKVQQSDSIPRAIQIIHDHYNKKITEQSVAGSVYLSSSYFSKVFKEATGIGFTRYLNQVRIEKAKSYLQNPNFPIDSIYKIVGYEHRSYFGKVFHQITGLTPKKYRDSTLKRSKV